MPGTRATFCIHKEIFSIDLIHMRTFYPNRFFLRMHTFVYQYFARSNCFIRFYIKLLYADCAMPAILRFIIRSIIIIYNISFPIFIKKERRIYSAHFRQHNRIRPLSKRILSFHKEITGSNIGGYHIISLIVGII